MISYIKGIILEKSAETATLLAYESIGYELFVPEDDLLLLKENQEAQFFCYHHITDRSENLYGFIARERKNLFKLFIEKVPGIGPKSALKIVSKADAERMKALIAKGDASSLASLGVGKKTAEKIIAALKEKMRDSDTAKTYNLPFAYEEALHALISLGYTNTEAENTLRKIDASDKTTEQIIKAALGTIQI